MILICGIPLPRLSRNKSSYVDSPHLHEAQIVARHELVGERGVPANAVHITVVDALLQCIDEIVLSHLRQQVQRIVPSRYPSIPSSSPTHENSVLVPVDGVEGLVVVPSVQDHLVRLLAVPDVIYASLPSYSATLHLLPQHHAAVHSARDELGLDARIIGHFNAVHDPIVVFAPGSLLLHHKTLR